MKICPVCNDSFGDELNFCDLDGARLTREGVAEQRNKWWSLLGAGLLIGGLVITGLSIIMIPRARVATPVVNSAPSPAPATPRVQPTETAPSVAAASPEPEPLAADTPPPELKKRDRSLTNSNTTTGPPNPKAAALDSEGVAKNPAPGDVKKIEPLTPKPAEALPASKSPRDFRAPDAPSKPPEVRGDHQPQPAGGKSSEKNSSDKKKNDEKDKKKGGFLKVFKKIFGKD